MKLFAVSVRKSESTQGIVIYVKIWYNIGTDVACQVEEHHL